MNVIPPPVPLEPVATGGEPKGTDPDAVYGLYGLPDGVITVVSGYVYWPLPCKLFVCSHVLSVIPLFITEPINAVKPKDPAATLVPLSFSHTSWFASVYEAELTCGFSMLLAFVALTVAVTGTLV